MCQVYCYHGLGRRSDTYIQRKNEVADVNHPCPKPDNVMRWIIERTTRPGETILDPFCGSGTTLKAAQEMGRHFIGVDISEEYCKLARKRVAGANVPLFTF